MDYTIVRGNTVRTGTFTVVASTDGTGGDLATDDTGATQNSNTGVVLTATETGSVITVNYNSTAIAIGGTLRYSIQRLG
jgi:hypothetical protein